MWHSTVEDRKSEHDSPPTRNQRKKQPAYIILKPCANLLESTFIRVLILQFKLDCVVKAKSHMIWHSEGGSTIPYIQALPTRVDVTHCPEAGPLIQ